MTEEFEIDDDLGPIDPECSFCGGDMWEECDDPIQCTYWGCDGATHPCTACQGTGLAKHQVVW